MKRHIMLLVRLLFTATVLIGCSLANPDACNWAFHTESLPELSAKVQADIEAAGIRVDSVSASAYGEDCYDPQIGIFKRFAVMQTDFVVEMRVDSFSDRDALGNMAAEGLAVLDGLAPSAVPGPTIGIVNFRFVAGDEMRNFVFHHNQWENAGQQDLRGEALIELLEEFNY